MFHFPSARESAVISYPSLLWLVFWLSRPCPYSAIQKKKNLVRTCIRDASSALLIFNRPYNCQYFHAILLHFVLLKYQLPLAFSKIKVLFSSYSLKLSRSLLFPPIVFSASSYKPTNIFSNRHLMHETAFPVILILHIRLVVFPLFLTKCTCLTILCLSLYNINCYNIYISNSILSFVLHVSVCVRVLLRPYANLRHWIDKCYLILPVYISWH